MAKSLNSNLERSSKCFAVFHKYARRPESKEIWTRRVFNHKVTEVLKHCLAYSETIGDEFQLETLGVGSGSGEVEYWMLSELVTSFPKISNLSIEPNAEDLSRYKQLIQTNKSQLSGITFGWHQQTLNEYRSTSTQKDTFHLITAIHSLYFEPDLEPMLQYLYDSLASCGVFIVALDSDENGFGQLRSKLPTAWDDHYHYCSASHVKAYFDRLKIPYTTLRRPSQVDVTPCFSYCPPSGDTGAPLQSPASGDGAMLLDFIFQVEDFHQSVSVEKQDELLRFLRSVSTVKDGQILFRCDTEYVVVQKSSSVENKMTSSSGANI